MEHEAAIAREAQLLGKLGVPGRADARTRRWGWIVTAVATAIAALTRLIGLNHPHHLAFDETYYVKGGYSLITYGYERDWVGDQVNNFFVQGSDAPMIAAADRVVHPPLGKWLIGAGMELFGTNTGLGWRFGVALAGIISVALITRIALRLTRSVPLAATAGLLLAIDGVAITLSRTAILDNFIALFTLAGFWALLRDREHSRRLLAHRVAHGQLRADGSPKDPWGPPLWYRPWLIAAGVFLGMGCGTKWNAIYALAVFGITAFAWDTAARRAVGTRLWFGAGVFRGGIPAFVSLVPTAAVTYVATWAAWFANPHSYRRGWAAEQREAGEHVAGSLLPDSVVDWIAYHVDMWQFHTSLSSPHTYQSEPWAWIIQWRPVSFYWPAKEKLVQDCGAERCVQAITSLGNPLLWWLALIGLAITIYLATRRDWRAWAVLAGYGGLYLPWYLYIGRTVYQFYSVAFVPYVVLALTLALGWVTSSIQPARAAVKPTDEEDSSWTGPALTQDAEQASTTDDATAAAANIADNTGEEPTEDAADDTTADTEDIPESDPAAARRRRVRDVPADLAWGAWHLVPTRREGIVLGVTLGVLLAVSAFWFPLWTGMTISYDFWKLHIWLPSWT
ncbi:MAG: phospholipid carrier-dependent glycosyltransferase [Flaviflexus sp.]|nr:phospholipid carrier-dependent glycosyltransferase [Flaviflexus sp.]